MPPVWRGVSTPQHGWNLSTQVCLLSFQTYETLVKNKPNQLCLKNEFWTFHTGVLIPPGQRQPPSDAHKNKRRCPPTLLSPRSNERNQNCSSKRINGKNNIYKESGA